jgi:bifunctional enzyme CysN/CysC
VRQIALVVSGLHGVGYSKDVFTRIAEEYRAFAAPLEFDSVECFPLAGPGGGNVTTSSPLTPWFGGPTLLRYLEMLPANSRELKGPFRLSVLAAKQFEGASLQVSGRVVGGSVRPTDRVRILPSGKESAVTRVVSGTADVPVATVGHSATLTIRDRIEVAPGDVVAAADSPPGIADKFEATVIWTSDEEMLPGRPYWLRIGGRNVGVSLGTPKYKVHVNTLEHVAARTLRADDVGVCNLHLDRPVPFDPYADNRQTGSFTLLDRLTGRTIGAGLLHFALRRSQNVHWQAIEVNKAAHASLNDHKPCIVWFTGLSGSGKSTIANLLEKKLHTLGRHTYLLDGDNVRHGLNKDLGFTEADRVENIRRVAEVARLMVDAGLIVLVSFISPFRAERRMARALVPRGEFCEVFVDTPLSVAEQRDPKGLYRKARKGDLKNFTGIDSPYEPPEQPEIRIDTLSTTAETAAERILAHLAAAGVFDPL